LTPLIDPEKVIQAENKERKVLNPMWVQEQQSAQKITH